MNYAVKWESLRKSNREERDKKENSINKVSENENDRNSGTIRNDSLRKN